MALDVRADPEPLLDPSHAPAGALLWCWTGKRLLWRDHYRCGHVLLADHRCGDDMAEDDDPFGIDRPAPKKNASPYAGVLHPVTGKPIGRHSRATNFIKGVTDDFTLQQWTNRMIVKGLAPEDLDELHSLDVSRDAARINEICSAAKRAAGGEEAASWGTKFHTRTEYWDLGTPEKIEPEFMPRVQDYVQALKDDYITVIPSLIERITVNTRYSSLIAGRLDRIVKLADGSLAILDVKSGSIDVDGSYQEKNLGISAQLALYQEAVTEYGVWDEDNRKWGKIPPVRDDIALVAHVPFKGSGCRMLTMDLALGRKALRALDETKKLRRTKGVAEVYVPPVKPMQQGSDEYAFLIDMCTSRDQLLSQMAALKEAGAWSEHYADLCRKRLKQVENPA